MSRAGAGPTLRGVAGKTVYALSCIAAALALVVSGSSYVVVKAVHSIGASHAIVSGPSIGAQNILLMGLESRTAEVDTVEKLTGVHIDHFGEVNLDGFYELAKVLGGVNVCLNHAVRDANSGANFRAGRQHLNASQALAFVRQRDGLPNGDLDRTHRQQAFLDAIMQQLRDQGVLGDLTKINALLSVGRQYVITDSGWNLLDFGTQMRDLTGGNLVFHTLPIEGYATYYVGGVNEDVNVINTAYIAAIVQATFYPKHSRAQVGATPSVTGSANASGTTIPTTGAQGGAVGAGNGTPCVN